MTDRVLERHYKPSQIAQSWGVSTDTIRRMFESEPGVLVLGGVPLERVSVLLGHSSIKITERHYSPWVQSRQTQLEADLARAWAQDPVCQTQRLARIEGDMQ